MDFSLTDEQRALRDAVRRLCDTEYPAPTRGDVEADDLALTRWRAWGQLGVLGAMLPAPLGGSDLGSTEAMLVAQELGRALVHAPVIPHALVAAPLLAQAAPQAPALGELLSGLALGQTAVVLAAHEDPSRHDARGVHTRAAPTTAASGAATWVLDGTKSQVLGGDMAQWLLVLARSAGHPSDPSTPSGLSLFAVPADAPGLRRRPWRTADGRGAAHIELHAVHVRDSQRLFAIGQAWGPVQAAIARAQAALCADSAGALQALLAHTVVHLNTRSQFGAPLAQQQVLQHAVAEMAMALEQITSMACVAAMAVAADDGATGPQGDNTATPIHNERNAMPQRQRLLHSACLLTAQLGRRCALAAIQMHGAMGMTQECRASHLAKRLITNGMLWGDASVHQHALMSHALALGPAQGASGVPTPVPTPQAHRSFAT